MLKLFIFSKRRVIDTKASNIKGEHVRREVHILCEFESTQSEITSMILTHD
jgi:hypothetical protein